MSLIEARLHPGRNQIWVSLTATLTRIHLYVERILLCKTFYFRWDRVELSSKTAANNSRHEGEGVASSVEILDCSCDNSPRDEQSFEVE
ncbi:hypothetical protein Trydic_g7974 [Trypoxylus dichotomus]